MKSHDQTDASFMQRAVQRFAENLPPPVPVSHVIISVVQTKFTLKSHDETGASFVQRAVLHEHVKLS